MKKDKFITKVIFRIWTRKDFKGSVIAFFPEEKENNNMILSYQHIGQHGAADYCGLLSVTRLATKTEYKELFAELTSIGYNLKIVKKMIKAS